MRTAVAPPPGAATTSDRIIERAQALFAERGYQGASTRELAAAAGVTERTLFRHFPTKALLFKAAVVTPIREFFEHWIGAWETGQGHRGLDNYDEALAFCSGLYEAIEGHHALFLSLVAMRQFGDDDVPGIAEFWAELDEWLDRLTHVMAVESAARGLRGIDDELTPRVLVGMVLSMAIFGDWLLGGSEGNRLKRELAMLTTFGITARPA